GSGEDRADARGPRLGRRAVLHLFDVQGNHVLRVGAGADRVVAAPDHGWTAVPTPRIGERPEELRPLLGPLLEQALLGGDVVAVRSAILRPIIGPQASAGPAPRRCRNEGDFERAIHRRLPWKPP